MNESIGHKRDESKTYQTAVIYHSNCYDGFGAAWAAYKKLGTDSTIYIPASYGEPAPAVPMDVEDIFILDFSYPPEQLRMWVKFGKRIVMLDHHKTAEEMLKPLIDKKIEGIDVHFDMTKSGALLAWEYFHKTKEAPTLIRYISDRDLWKFEMFGTKEVHAALTSHPMDFKVWDKFNTNTLFKEGQVALRLREAMIDNVCRVAQEVKIGEHKVPAVNTSFGWSEVGAKLLEQYKDAPFVASFTVYSNNVMWSLRSKDDFDVSEVAKAFGGGGHKNAAGFKQQREDTDFLYEVH